MDAEHKCCASKRLQLNPSKTKVIWFDTNPNLIKIQSIGISLHVGADTIASADAVRDLGVIIDGELWRRISLKSPVSATNIFGT